MLGRSLAVSIVTFLLIGITTLAAAQEGSPSDPRRSLRPESAIGASDQQLPFFSPVRPQGCEINRLYVDDAGGRARKIAGSHVIVIGRLGDGERSSQLNRRRLEEVQRFLEQLVSVKSVTAEGKRVQGYGVVELYVGGRLLYTLPLQRNRPIHLGSCEFP